MNENTVDSRAAPKTILYSCCGPARLFTRWLVSVAPTGQQRPPLITTGLDEMPVPRPVIPMQPVAHGRGMGWSAVAVTGEHHGWRGGEKGSRGRVQPRKSPSDRSRIAHAKTTKRGAAGFVVVFTARKPGPAARFDFSK